jgi:hypothetical protein
MKAVDILFSRRVTRDVVAPVFVHFNRGARRSDAGKSLVSGHQIRKLWPMLLFHVPESRIAHPDAFAIVPIVFIRPAVAVLLLEFDG